MALSDDIAIRSLKSGMLHSRSEKQIKEKMNIFLRPEKTKSHGRAIYRDEAEQAGLNINRVDVKSDMWKLVYELYVRADNYVSTRVAKCMETHKEAFFVAGPDSER